MEAIIVYLVIAIVISIIAIKEDRADKLAQKIKRGFKPNSVDRDKDGILQEGTEFERPAKRRK